MASYDGAQNTAKWLYCKGSSLCDPRVVKYDKSTHPNKVGDCSVPIKNMKKQDVA